MITSYGRSLRRGETSLGLEDLGVIAAAFLERSQGRWSIWLMVFVGCEGGCWGEQCFEHRLVVWQINLDLVLLV